MRILNTKQIRELDARTIAQEPIASIDLMERAARAFVDWLTAQVDMTKRVCVVCGTGNNGGDGLAIARMLHGWGYPVRVYVVKGGGNETDDFKANAARLPQAIEKREVTNEVEQVSFGECDVLIDAVFGSGLSRPVTDVYARAIEAINATDALRIAVDIPSGLMADAPSVGAIVRADYTVSFQLPKLAFMMPDSYPFTGKWLTVDIGLDKDFIRSAETPYHYIRPRAIRKMLRPRSKYDHKGTFGHAVLVAGSYGKMGAAVLASRAALRAGVGLLTVHVPRCGYGILQTAVPEAMVTVDENERFFSLFGESVDKYGAIGVGPGLGKETPTVRALTALMERFRKPMVFDADALNIIAENRHLMALVPPGSILTPHPGEFKRLAGEWQNDFERLALQRQLAASLKSVVVLKGAHTSIASADGLVYFNSTGNPGMATGGTGDVLTGIVTGLLAQYYSPVEAAVAGVFLHGMAGDLAATALSMESMVASDLIAHLPEAFIALLRKEYLH